MVHTFDLTGKVILLTGGYGYLGKAAAKSLVYHGGTVYVLGRSKEKFAEAFDDNDKLEKQLYFQSCDVSSTASIQKAFKSVMDAEGQIYEDFPESLNPPHYGAAKAGVVQLSKYYASYLGKKGITVNTVTPGPYPSKEVQKREKFVELLAEKTLLKRIGQPEELAGAFVFLASDASSYMTGQNIIIDGGWTAV